MLPVHQDGSEEAKQHATSAVGVEPPLLGHCTNGSDPSSVANVVLHTGGHVAGNCAARQWTELARDATHISGLGESRRPNARGHIHGSGGQL